MQSRSLFLRQAVLLLAVFFLVPTAGLALTDRDVALKADQVDTSQWGSRAMNSSSVIPSLRSGLAAS